MFPAGTGVRVDTHIQAGATVPPHYDSLLAKVIGHGADRGEALATLRGALDRCAVDGVVTNLDMHRGLLADAEFGKGGVDTGYLGRFLESAAYVRDDPRLGAMAPRNPAGADSGVGDG